MHRQLAAFALLWFLGSLSSFGQARPPATVESRPRTFSIRGSLRDNESSRPIEMIKVELKKLAGEVVSTTFTRSNGEFEFNGLPNGVYYVVVEEKGFEPVRESIEVLNSSRAGVFIFLKKPLQANAPSPPGPTVSARELSIPRKPHEAWQKGMERLYEKNDAKGSVAHFQRAINELPSYYEAYHHLGVAYIRMGQLTDAEQALRKSIELSENSYAAPCFDLAALLSNIQRFDEAEKTVRRGLDLDANAWQGHLELARALLGQSRVDAAEKSLEQARLRRADYPQLYLVSANIHIRRKDYPALLQDLDTYLRLEPNGPTSDQARQMRETVQRTLANARNAPSTPPPKP